MVSIMLKFHEFRNGMVVMDDRKGIATAKPTRHGWILTLYAASWVDPRARTQGLIPGKFPHLLLVESRGDARNMLKALAKGPFR
jgi:hypothetical protein